MLYKDVKNVKRWVTIKQTIKMHLTHLMHTQYVTFFLQNVWDEHWNAGKCSNCSSCMTYFISH